MRERRVERSSSRERLRKVIRGVRRRWRARLLVRGGAVVMAAFLAAVGISVWGLEATRFSPGAVTAFRWITWGGVAAAALFYLVRPLLRRVTDEQVALYLEEHEPSLKASVLGAVEAERAGDEISPAFLDRLVERAVSQARSVQDGRRIDQPGLYRASGVLTTLTLASLVLLLFGPLGFRQGATALLPNRDVASVNPYAILVAPGDLTVARGSDQFIQAELVGFTSQDVTLVTRPDGDDDGQRLSMIPRLDDGGFEVLLVGLEEGLSYSVESDGVRSPEYRIEVVELPYVDRMDHVYRFPRYTGLPERTVEGAGDIAVLPGTAVTLTVHPTLGTPGGRLLLDGEDPLELMVEADGTLTGSFTVTRRSFYSVELALADGTFVSASPEYTIDLLADQPPSLSITRPGRDTPASPIEEVYIEAEADDDYGVDELLLVYSVNGGAEDTLALYSSSGRPLSSVTAGHTLYLEDYEVSPGDLVSYYAVTRDLRQGPGDEVVSDIYFVEVQPFRRDFRQAEQQGGQPPGGQMGGGQQEESLSELQKQVVAATFNLLRDRERYTESEFGESVTAVALAQGRVREQVATLAERMTNRGLTAAEERFREIAEMLPEAISAMELAETELRELDPRDALGPEQQALRVIQKAEETYERYVGQQQPQGGGGGQGGANAEDLADLFELELDQLQNQYETVQRGERQQANEEVDELLERLQELARRQEQEAERQRARSSNQQGSASAGGGASAQSQRELADEAEETARQLQRLSRETGDRELAETARELQQAADAMRRAAANAGNAGSAEAQRALDRLQQARERLQEDRESRLEEDVQEAQERVRGLRERQEEIQQELENLPDSPSERREAIREMVDDKGDMAREALELRQDLSRLSQEARARDPEAGRALEEAARAIDEEKLVEKIQYSRGVVEMREPEFARIGEEGIEASLEVLEEALAEAADAADRMAGREGLESTLEEAQDLQDRMASLDRRLENRAGQGQEGQPGGEPGQEGQAGDPSGEPGQEGQASDPSGEPGQQGGQQGQGGANPEGGNPGTPSGGDVQGGGAVGGSRPPLSPEEVRQFQRELQERLQDATRLRDGLREQGRETGELEDALDALRRLQDPDVLGDLPQVAILQEVIRESLGRLEFSLRREVRGDEAPAALGGAEAVPEGFRSLVEEYYRRLARERGGG